MQRLVLLLATFCLATPAVAQEAPLLRPSRDVAVEYGTGGATRSAGTSVTMHYAGNGRWMRIDPASGTSYSVFDIQARHVMIVRTDARTFEDRTSDPSQIPLYFTRDATFQKLGVDTIAGLRCTNYDATFHANKGQICLTDDGVILRARTGQGDSLRELVALKVTYAEQPLTLFAPPDGYQNTETMPTDRKPMQRFMENPGRPAGSH
jgi:hypothetical protein